MNETETSIFEQAGLKGRKVRAPSKNKVSKNHLFIIVYGLHASLERVSGLTAFFQNYGEVLVPDLPGFGGMDSFYKMGKKPVLENYANFLADFLKRETDKKSYTIISISFGFLIVSKMFQLYPEMLKNNRAVFSMAGFLSPASLKFSPQKIRLYRWLTLLISSRLGAFIAQNLILNSFILKQVYKRSPTLKPKLIDKNNKQADILEMEIKLWRLNDTRTWAAAIRQMLITNLVGTKIKGPLYHIVPSIDQYFDAKINEKELKAVYESVRFFKINLKTHAPTIVATAEEVSSFMSPELKRQLADSYLVGAAGL